MGRLRLLGEQEGGGVDDHSALSNLDYAQSGHTGFVPSQGEALIDILRLNQNLIRDSGGNDRITLSTASPHISLTGDLRLNGWAAIRSAPAPNQLLTLNPSETWTGASVYMIRAQPAGTIDANINLFALSLSATPAVATGRTVNEMKGIASALVPAPSGTISNLGAVEAALATFGGFGGAITTARFFNAYPAALGWWSIRPSTVVILDASDIGHASISNVYGIRIPNLSGVTVRLLELGPPTPYLRLEGGAAPSGNDSKLVLNFGGTLYRLTRDPATGAVQTAAP